MDLSLYSRVFWRFRYLVAAGLLLAVCLSFLAFVRVGGSPKLKYREQEQWSSSTTLLVQPPGFTWGEVSSADLSVVNTYGSLALLYAKLATSDAVKRIVLRHGPIKPAKIDATYISQTPADPTGPALPLISILATAPSAHLAVSAAARQTAAFVSYLANKQAQNGIAPGKRVRIALIQRAQPAELLKGRSKTLPIVVFLTVMLAVVGLAFMLENLRPRVHVVESEDTLHSPARRTA
jgi:nucleoid-associated protein YgaU